MLEFVHYSPLFLKQVQPTRPSTGVLLLLNCEQPPKLVQPPHLLQAAAGMILLNFMVEPPE
jgi:hypothetical protein